MSQNLILWDVKEGDLRARFRDAILDKNHGLRCIVLNISMDTSK